MNKITVRNYDPDWPKWFEQLKNRLADVVGDLAQSIEHVGSTSVPGLAAKPIIDLDVVVHADNLAKTIERLAVLGYEHVGNLGVEGREAFRNPPNRIPHHLYVCAAGGLGLRNHLAVRDFLRQHPATAKAYGELKKRLAAAHDNDIDSYIDGKTDFLLSILRQADLDHTELEQIEAANRKE